MLKRKLLTALFMLFTIAVGAQTIAINGNSYITSANKEGVKITKAGVTDWTNPDAVISTYVKLHATGELNTWIKIKNGGKPSNIKVTVAGKEFYINFKSEEFMMIPVGKVQIKDTGYIAITLQGVSTKDKSFGEVAGYELSGQAVTKGVVHCGDFEPYWTSRGPSVHMKYMLPKDKQIRRFYNEVTVKKGNDPVGSYYMACGFGEGYFGMQANSDTERRILFSVWSPFDTQDPKLIPDSMKIKLLKRGEGVTIGEFGNEGSGGQSYLKYNWITGNTYKFLMQVEPDGKNNTVYTAYFFAPEKGKWQLIAQFMRPQTNTHYTNAHSFLENFIPNQGYITRQVDFGNQWAQTVDGEWIEITGGLFTFDATARAGVRKDYAGGLNQENGFFLRNCGFFNQSTEFKSLFNRAPENKKPVIDIE